MYSTWYTIFGFYRYLIIWRKRMKKSFKITAALSAILASGILAVNATQNHVEAKSYSKAVTKIAGTKNYAIYHRVSSKGPSGKFTSTKYFKHGQIQSKQYVSTKI